MKSTSVPSEDLASLPRASLIEDRFGDVAVRLDDGLWQFSETTPLPAEYVIKHYAPFSLLAMEAGDRIRWPEMAMSMPLGSVLEYANGERFTKTTQGTWRGTQGRDEVSSRALVTREPLTVVAT